MQTNDASSPQFETAAFELLAVGLFFNDMVFSGLPADGPQPGRELRTAPYLAVPGGIANSSIAAARIGLDVGMVSDVGDDTLGRGMLETLEREGVNTRNCLIHRDWQTPLTVILNYAHDRAMVTAETPHPGACVLRQREHPRAAVAIAHLQPFAMPWLAEAAAHGTLVIGDCGWDESGAWDLAALPDLVHCRSFTPNLTEALHYTRTDNPDAALLALAEYVPEPVITMGGDGAIALDQVSGDVIRVGSLPVTVIDASGAGDVFNAGWAAGLLTSWPLEQRLKLAVAMASLTVARPGGAITSPTLGELWQWVANLPADSGLAADYAFVADIATHHQWSRR
ncbi:carbohydrate kinase family protein [Tessaracoccus sp. SD287]|uniref:carbohydrate kinase family protein n=1 Tax=Tessaracoccus sp. SD287 TaxID=2782008 RepID=UPI001A962271|nr:carbohydrate kinase family protein [Tessaracoccus sp. SD287]